MTNPYVDLAKLLDNDEGKATGGIQTCKVVSGLPNLVIQVGDMNIDKDNLLMCSSANINGHTIRSGDTVLVIPLQNNQMYIVIDTVRKVG